MVEEVVEVAKVAELVVVTLVAKSSSQGRTDCHFGMSIHSNG